MVKELCQKETSPSGTEGQGTPNHQINVLYHLYGDCVEVFVYISTGSTDSTVHSTTQYFTMHLFVQLQTKIKKMHALVL